MSDFRTQRWIALVCLGLALMWQAQGADTEIYTEADAINPAVPNVLLLLEASNPMRVQGHNANRPVTEKDSLLYQAAENAKNLINYYYDNPQIPIRIGLMRHWNNHARILVPIKPLEQNYSDLLIELDELTKAKLAGQGSGEDPKALQACLDLAKERGWDPKVCPEGKEDQLLVIEGQVSNVGALNEARLYFQGGNSTTPIGSYTSPIQFECQKNHVVVFTDGNPNPANLQPIAADVKPPALSLACQTDADCLGLMTEHLRIADVRDDLDGAQTIETHIVRLTPHSTNPDPVLAAAVAQGGYGAPIDSNPDLFTKDNRQADFINHITTPFAPPVPAQIGGQVITRSRVISATGEVSYDHFIYYGLFQPGQNKRWPGNLKKYALKTDADGHITAIVDKNGDPAVEDGQFLADATSYWNLSDEPDGDQTTAGGAAHRLTDYKNGQHSVNDRRVFTRNPQAEVGFPVTLSAIRPEGTPLNNNHFVVTPQIGLRKSNDTRSLSLDPGAAHRISHCSGTPIPPGLGNRSQRALANWIRGMDVCDADGDARITDGRPAMGAVLHSKPVVVPFGGDVGNVLLVLSNSGYLHMLQIDEATDTGVVGNNPESGLERAAIFPGIQLTGDNLLRTYAVLENLNGEPVQMLDGDITLFVVDADGDGDLLDANDVGDGAAAYFGQRRGGRNMFAFHLGNPGDFSALKPHLLWHIEGGKAETAFENLGQTWSTPKHTSIAERGQRLRQAILFGGGYDAANFDCQTMQNNNCIDESLPEKSIGNALYMVDAFDGELLWWAGDDKGDSKTEVFKKHADMRYSFPAPLRIVDTDGNGHADAFFGVDIAGQVWRFDIAGVGPFNNKLHERITGGVIADLHGGKSGELHNRRFFNTPDVAYDRNANGDRQLRINIGSGYRAHPLDTGTQDRMYSLVQPLNKPTTYAKRKIEDLLDITALDTASEIAALTPAQRTKLDRGWYLDLNVATGEKILSDPFTFRGVVYFSTYTPPVADTNPCNPPDFGTNRLYVLDSNNGRPALNQSANTPQDTSTNPDSPPPDESDRSLELENTGIAPTPDLVFSADGTQIIAGTEILDDTRTAPIPGRQILYWSRDK